MSSGLALYHRKGPTIAVLCLVAVPLIGLVGLGLAGLGVSLRPGALGSLVVLSLGSIVAGAAMAARLKAAPLFSAAAGVAGWLASGAIARLSIPEGVHPEEWAAMAGTGGTGELAVLMLVAAGLGLWRRDVYTGGWEPTLIRARLVAGLRSMLKDSPNAEKRALASLPVLVLTFLLAGLLLPDAVPGEPPAGGIGGSTTIVALGTTGIGLLASSLRVPDEDEVDLPGDDAPPPTRPEPPSAA